MVHYEDKIPFTDCKPFISKYVETLFQTHWNDCSNNKLHEIRDTFFTTIQIYSNKRKEDIILTRLRIGHTRLTHKHSLLKEDFPECIAGDSPMTVKHILIECADTALTREKCFNCNDLKTLFYSVAGNTILAYLSEINLLCKIPPVGTPGV